MYNFVVHSYEIPCRKMWHIGMDLVLSKIWESIDGCAEHYRCATALYLMSILSHDFYVIIDHGIDKPGHGREVVYMDSTPSTKVFSYN